MIHFMDDLVCQDFVYLMQGRVCCMRCLEVQLTGAVCLGDICVVGLILFLRLPALPWALTQFRFF